MFRKELFFMNKYFALLATAFMTSSFGNTTIPAGNYDFDNKNIAISTPSTDSTFLSLSGTAILYEPILTTSDIITTGNPVFTASGTTITGDSVLTTSGTSIKRKAKSKSGILKAKKSKKPKYTKMEVPKHNNFKSYMGYRSITCKASKQYKLQQRAKTGKYGIRTIKGRYLIALGTYYTKNVGDKFDIKLSDGTILKCMIGDIKSDRHTDSKRQKQKYDGSIMEFITDPSKMPSYVKRAGSYTACEKFSGSIKEIRKLK